MFNRESDAKGPIQPGLVLSSLCKYCCRGRGLRGFWVGAEAQLEWNLQGPDHKGAVAFTGQNGLLKSLLL